MEQFLAFARGPLFAVTFLIMVLGLARHVVVQLHMLLGKGQRLRQVRWRRLAADSLSWVLPIRHLTRGTVLLSLTSFLFHVGAVAVPLLLADHVALWERLLGVHLPALTRGLAELLTILAIACGALLLLYRMLVSRARALSSFADYTLLVLVLLPFVSGCLAAHPGLNPLPWNVMMLVHIVSAEALFVAVPFTKLAHVVLFPFDRLSQVHWQLQPGSGERVAVALYGEEVKV
jgi:nitrate reductase gamma subunit